MVDAPSHSTGDEPRVVDLDAMLKSVRPHRPRVSKLLRRRQRIVLICLALVPGTLSVSIGYGLYLRSDRYRAALEASLEERLGMDVKIGRSIPMGWRGRILSRVEARLPEQGTQVFACERATWARDDRAEDGRYMLTLEEGWVRVGESAWSRSEYEQLLKSGLGHKFDTAGVSEVRLSDIDVRFDRDAFQFSAEGASGVLFIEPDGAGRASVDCNRLNGVAVDHAVNIAARFTPGERKLPEFHEVRLTVPTIPIAVLNLSHMLGGEVSHGSFAGTIVFAPVNGSDRVTITGRVQDADLSECTTLVPGGPYRGRVAVDLQEAVVTNGRLERLDGAGQIYDLHVGDLAPSLVAATGDALLTLSIDAVRLRGDYIERLAASGHCANLSLGAITNLVGQGTITGTASLDVRSLLIVDDKVQFADATVDAIPPTQGPAIISREVIGSVAQRWLGFNPGALLPEQIDYLQLGVRMIVENQRLRLRGTHGVDGTSILTVRLFDQPLAIVREPARTFDVPDLVALVRSKSREFGREDVRRVWERVRDIEAEKRE